MSAAARVVRTTALRLCLLLLLLKCCGECDVIVPTPSMHRQAWLEWCVISGKTRSSPGTSAKLLAERQVDGRRVVRCDRRACIEAGCGALFFGLRMAG